MTNHNLSAHSPGLQQLETGALSQDSLLPGMVVSSDSPEEWHDTKSRKQTRTTGASSLCLVIHMPLRCTWQYCKNHQVFNVQYVSSLRVEKPY